ncbi:MAG: PIN domain-containing protein [Candidatus Bathyarchaeia archaeon]
MPVLETDFLLGLRKGDKKHGLSMEVLRLHKEGLTSNIVVCGSAFAELAIGLKGRLSRTETMEVLRNVRALTSSIPEAGLNSAILSRGLEPEERLSITNLYDCLHAATALEHDSSIVSDDRFYDSIPSLRRIGLEAYAKQKIAT